MFQCDDHLTDLNAYPYHIRDVHISDPFILPDAGSGRYYTYVQFVDSQRFPDVPAGPGHFYVLESPDLIHWSEPRVCFEKGDFWADRDYWAPECHIWKGRYYLISSFRTEGSYRRCQCLVSDSPEGPFRPVREEPLTPEGWHCLDGTLYIDRKGAPWLVFCHEWLQVDDGQICAVPLSDDLGEATGDPVILFRASDGPWTGRSGVTDGPFLHRLPGGKLLMLWSSFTAEGSYAISYAISGNGEILGPWKQREDPLYSLDGGHGMLFRTFSGQLMMACHCPNDHIRKRILLFEMEETADALHITNEVTGNWYQAIGGRGKAYAYRTPCTELPCCSRDTRKEGIVPAATAVNGLKELTAGGNE